MKNREAFTLIELLVVIVIIAMLLAITLPALRAAKELAKKIICMAHTRGTGDAVLIYAQQQDGALPSPLDGAFICGPPPYDPARKDLGLDWGSDYYTYHNQPGRTPLRGVSGVGFLYKAGLIESGSDLVFCPSMLNLFGNKMPTQEWNPKGQITHWNYIGQPVAGATYILEVPDQHIGWMPVRITIGIRKLYHLNDKKGYKKVEDASVNGKRAFLCDLWVSTGKFGNYWKTRDTDIPHKTSARPSVNTWYMDGHAENVKIGSEMFQSFTDPATGLSENYLVDATWSNMLD